MTPLRDDPATPRALAEALRAARDVPPATPVEQAAVWRQICATADARAAARTSPWTLLAPALAAFALTLLFAPRFLTLGPARVSAQAPDLLAQRHVRALPGAQVLASAGSVQLSQGSALAGPGAALKTPQLEVQVTTATCFVQVAGAFTTLDVSSGSLRVRRGDGPWVALVGPVRFRSDDPRLAPRAPAPVPTTPLPAVEPAAEPARAVRAARPIPSDPCAAGAASSRRGCYLRASQGSDLAAQNAAYLLGQLQRTQGDLPGAVAAWQQYQRRFPQGVLWPEAASGVLAAHLAEQKWPEALADADAYLARVGQGDRADEVALIRANLLLAHLHQPQAARQAYRALTGPGVPDAVRGEATFGLAQADAQQGQAAEAQAAFARYLRDWPSGPHAAEVAGAVAR